MQTPPATKHHTRKGSRGGTWRRESPCCFTDHRMTTHHHPHHQPLHIHQHPHPISHTFRSCCNSKYNCGFALDPIITFAVHPFEYDDCWLSPWHYSWGDGETLILLWSEIKMIYNFGLWSLLYLWYCVRFLSLDVCEVDHIIVSFGTKERNLLFGHVCKYVRCYLWL
jgi:hypothetical protein